MINRRLLLLLPLIAMSPLLMAPDDPGCRVCIYEAHVDAGSPKIALYTANPDSDDLWQGLAQLEVYDGSASLTVGGTNELQCQTEDAVTSCTFVAAEASPLKFVVESEDWGLYDLELY